MLTNCYTTNTDTSNSMTMTVNSNVIPTLSIAGTDTICAGASVIYNATSNVSDVSYQWIVNGSNVGTNNNTWSYTPANGDIVKCITGMPSGCFTANADTSNSINMSVNPNISPTLSISGNNTLCAGTPDTFTATSNVSGIMYQWLLNGNYVGTNSGSYS